MEAVQPSVYIEKIVLEIEDRPRLCFQSWRVRRKEKFDLAKFNAREAAYAFLRRYDGESFVKTQKVKVWCNNQELRLCVRDLFYGCVKADPKRTANTMVAFVYRQILFSEIKWPMTTAYRTNRVRWAHDYDVPPKIHIEFVQSATDVNESTNADVRAVPCGNENGESLRCRQCRGRLSVSGVETLRKAEDQARVPNQTDDEENHFRSSIHFHLKRFQY